MLRNLGFHGWGHAKRAVNPRKVIVHEVEAGRMLEILYLFTKAVGQAREASHGHTHRQILPLDVARGNVHILGIALNPLGLDTDTLRGAIAGFGLWRRAIDFDEHGIIDLCPKR